MEFKTWFPVVAPIGTWIMVFIGWLFVRHDNNTRENRRELRSYIDGILTNSRIFEEKGRGYYSIPKSDENSSKLESEIRRISYALDGSINFINSLYKDKKPPRFSELYSRWHNFRNSVTGGTFEQHDRPACPATDGKLLEISTQCNDLAMYLEKEYCSIYKK